jgi:signal transduction histidine kinase
MNLGSVDTSIRKRRFRGWRFRSLAARYASLAGGVAVVLLVASGAMEMYFSFVDAREQIGRGQATQAKAAAAEIEQYLSSVRAGLKGVAQLPWGQRDFGDDQRREEFYRLMVLFPSIVELSLVDAKGVERLAVSRRVTDRIATVQPVPAGGTGQASGKPYRGFANLSTGQTAYGDPYFEDDATPYVRLAVSGPHDGGRLTVATLDLRFLDDVIRGLRVGGQIHIVDRNDMLIAHTRATHVLRRLDMSASPAVRAVRATGTAPVPQAIDAVDLDGRPVISTAVPVFAPGWLLFVEQPRSEALRPMLATLTRTLALVVMAALVAFAASVVFARRLAAPVIGMRRATERIANGDFGSRVSVDTGDELEQLGHDFNRMASRLETFYADLESRIHSRTEELLQARDAAERASSAKTRFLASASHDLRQPMHTIGLLSTVLRSRVREDEAVQLATKLQACAALMENLFASLLDISKLDSGAVHPEKETFPVAELLSRITVQFEPQAATKALRLRVRSSRAIVQSDPGILERILVNMVSNAVRYTAQGKVLVGCRRRGTQLALQVLDTGPGIAAEHLDRIFDEFVRLDAGSARFDKGLGLGLSIVRRSAQVLGHAVNVRSTPGRGSCFEILLPCLSWMPPSSGATAGRHSTDEAASRAAGAFIVVLDDDEGNRHALEALCTQWGCHVLAVESIAAAIDELGRHLRSPDLLITDLRLGEQMDGFMAIDALQAACGEAVPALIVTADVDAGLFGTASARGVELLHKPVSEQRLRAAVEHAVQGRPTPTT